MNIKLIRKTLGMTQVEFASELRISRGSLTDYERGKTAIPPYIIHLIELYVQIHGAEGLFKHNSILLDKKAALEEEIMEINMSDLNQYLITGVRYDEDHKFIVQVHLRAIREEKTFNRGNPMVATRASIMKAIGMGTKMFTALKKVEGTNWTWVKKAEIEIIKLNKVDYIRSEKNDDEKDNLAELPEF